MLKVGLLGAGRIGNVHAEAIAAHRGSALVAVSDAFAQNAEKLAATFDIAVAQTQSILDDPGIDAVVIATPTDTHSDLIEAACARGKAVFCEKPVDLDLARAKACMANVAASDVPVMVAFNRRFDPNFAAMKSGIAAGEIGKPELLSITSFDPAPPPVSYVKVSGGLFRDMMIHDFDMSHFLMGELPRSVHAVGSSIVEPAIGAAGDIDTAVVTFSYGDGRIAVIKNSRRAVFGYDQRAEVLGSEGMLQVGNVLENTLVKSTQAGVTGAKPTYFFLERYMPAYKAEWASFVEAVTTQTPVPVSLADGVAALALAEAATQSLHRGVPQELADFL